ncbi:hypothetical protein KP509_1Z179200 [Ceratopteris richardii]|nr:hypothetical protein KP509_1Z179200 [Ceratopteris richardii]
MRGFFFFLLLFSSFCWGKFLKTMELPSTETWFGNQAAVIVSVQ